MILCDIWTQLFFSRWQVCLPSVSLGLLAVFRVGQEASERPPWLSCCFGVYFFKGLRPTTLTDVYVTYSLLYKHQIHQNNTHSHTPICYFFNSTSTRRFGADTGVLAAAVAAANCLRGLRGFWASSALRTIFLHSAFGRGATAASCRPRATRSSLWCLFLSSVTCADAAARDLHGFFFLVCLCVCHGVCVFGSIHPS